MSKVGARKNIKTQNIPIHELYLLFKKNRRINLKLQNDIFPTSRHSFCFIFSKLAQYNYFQIVDKQIRKERKKNNTNEEKTKKKISENN